MEPLRTRWRTRGAAGLLLWFRIARIYHRNLHSASQNLRSFSLTPAQFDILAQVSASEGLSQRDLAARLLVTAGNITQHVTKLEGRGLITRARSGHSNALTLTSAGRTLLESALPAQESLQAAQFRGLSVDETRVLLSLLRKLDRAQRRAHSAQGADHQTTSR